MSTNSYGTGDYYDAEIGHVMPVLIRRFHEVKEAGLEKVTCWVTGSPMREFLHRNYLGHACVFAMEKWNALSIDAPTDNQGNPLSVLYVGAGVDLTIKDPAQQVAAVVGFEGLIEWDKTKPNGTPKKQI